MPLAEEVSTSVAHAVDGHERQTLPVAVIVTGRVRTGYLVNAFESIEAQDPAPAEVIYVDDGSNAAATLAAHEYHATVISTRDVPMGRVACRNHGAQHTQQPFLIFLDSDAVLGRGYVKQMLDRIVDSPRYGFVFPRVRFYGHDSGELESRREVRYADLVRKNFVPTQSIVRRQAFTSVHGWRDLPDWDFWLRIVEQGWLFAEASQTWAEVRGREYVDDIGQVEYQTVQRARPLTLFTPFGPGGPIRGRDYFNVLDSLDLNWPRTTLLFYDNSNNHTTAHMLRQYLDYAPAGAVVYVHDTHRIESEDGAQRLYTVPERMAEIWSRASEHFGCPFILSLEDDIEPACDAPLDRLYEALAPDVDAVSGFCKSRPVNGHSRELVFDWKQREDGHLALDAVESYPGGAATPPSDGYLPVGATGLGFSLIRRDTLDGFEYDTGQFGNWCGQDFGLWRHVRECGNKLMLHFGVPCKHFHTPTEWV